MVLLPELGDVMGDMADYDLYENINNVGTMEGYVYKCGLCGKKFGGNKGLCQEHVNKCKDTKDEK